LAELALSQVERLREEYHVQERLREGAQSMAAAFAKGPSTKQRGNALDKVQSGYMECLDVLGSLEAQMETMVGVFHCQIQGIQGFARLCPGDVFELSIRHCNQKWKARGRVCKDGSQSWDRPRASFTTTCLTQRWPDGSSTLASSKSSKGNDTGSPAVLIIKAREVKRGPLHHRVLLGCQKCDLLQLMVPRPVALCLPLNQSGSLKLNLLIVWR
jgi:hypothetical protein